MGTKLLLLDFVLLLAQMASAGTCKLDAHTAASDAAEVSTTMKCIIDFAVQSQPLISPVADSKKKESVLVVHVIVWERKEHSRKLQHRNNSARKYIDP